MIRLIFSLVFLIFPLNCGHLVLPSEETLIRNFSKNKCDFYRLVVMMNEDTDIRQISNDYIFYISHDERTISDERLKVYRQILKELGINKGIHRDDSKSVRLVASTKGIPIETYSKAYLYTTEVPEPLVESIDKFVSSSKQPPVYRKLEENWYLVYESW